MWKTIGFAMIISSFAQAGSCANPPNFFMCNFDYEPVICTAWRYRNEPLNPPIEVKASNSCFADMAIDSKICSMGLAPEAMFVTDVVCQVLPHE